MRLRAALARLYWSCVLLAQLTPRILAVAEHGDRPRPLPEVAELKKVAEVFSSSGPKWWDWDPVMEQWGWTRAPPESQKLTSGEVRGARHDTVRQHPTRAGTCGTCASAPVGIC